MELINIYTDASHNHFNNKQYCGLGVFVVDQDETEYMFARKLEFKDIKFNCRKDTQRFEMIAIFKAVRMSLRKFGNKVKTVIYTDNLTAYNMINEIYSPKRKAKENYGELVGNIKEMIKTNQNIEVRHIRAHVKVYGNEKADKLAKKAHETHYKRTGINTI